MCLQGVTAIKRYAQVIQLRPEDRQAYIDCHAAVWPEVLKTINQCNIRNYSIYLHQDLVIAYFEYHGSDYDADMLRMAKCPFTQKWWFKVTDPMLISLQDTSEMLAGSTGIVWKRLPEVFHVD